jgi:hypothetical protein
MSKQATIASFFRSKSSKKESESDGKLLKDDEEKDSGQVNESKLGKRNVSVADEDVRKKTRRIIEDDDDEEEKENGEKLDEIQAKDKYSLQPQPQSLGQGKASKDGDQEHVDALPFIGAINSNQDENTSGSKHTTSLDRPEILNPHLT